MKITASVVWTIAVALVCIIVCMTVITVTGHDVTIFVVAIGLLLTSATGFVAVFLNQKKQSHAIEAVRSNTNGTLSRLLDSYEKAIAREAVMASATPSSIVTALHEPTLDAHEVKAIRERIAE